MKYTADRPYGERHVLFQHRRMIAPGMRSREMTRWANSSREAAFLLRVLSCMRGPSNVPKAPKGELRRVGG